MTLITKTKSIKKFLIKTKDKEDLKFILLSN